MNKNSNCDGIQNSSPNFIEIFSETCEKKGYKSLMSPHECSQATGDLVNIRTSDNYNNPRGCVFLSDDWTYNAKIRSDTDDIGQSSVSRAWCKE